MESKLIKTEADYKRALARVEGLMAARAGSPEGDELELLVTLIELYEHDAFPIGLPDPAEAIKFRMEQSGLRQQDLVPFLGSRSRVSEVLSGKRSLSLKMIRALHSGLNIPADVLLQEPNATLPPAGTIEWAKFPVAEMAKRGWFRGFQGLPANAREYAEELMRSFVGKDNLNCLAPKLLKQHVRSGSEMDEYALSAWRTRVLQMASHQARDSYDSKRIVSDLKPLVHLSYLAEGPRLAQEYLAKRGIALVILAHLPRTHLDGAALMLPDGHPVVALTLRHDRLDNFWFTLLHELGHVVRHFGSGTVDTVFIDDLSPGVENLKRVEKEADSFAMDNLIPARTWSTYAAQGDFSPRSVCIFADQLRICAAIVAGRVRREADNYRLLTSLVGYRTVRNQFSNLEGAQLP